MTLQANVTKVLVMDKNRNVQTTSGDHLLLAQSSHSGTLASGKMRNTVMMCQQVTTEVTSNEPALYKVLTYGLLKSNGVTSVTP